MTFKARFLSWQRRKVRSELHWLCCECVSACDRHVSPGTTERKCHPPFACCLGDPLTNCIRHPLIVIAAVCTSLLHLSPNPFSLSPFLSSQTRQRPQVPFTRACFSKTLSVARVCHGGSWPNQVASGSVSCSSCRWMSSSRVMSDTTFISA